MLTQSLKDPDILIHTFPQNETNVNTVIDENDSHMLKTEEQERSNTHEVTQS